MMMSGEMISRVDVVIGDDDRDDNAECYDTDDYPDLIMMKTVMTTLFHLVSSTSAIDFTNYIIYIKISVIMYVNMLPCTDYSSNKICIIFILLYLYNIYNIH